MKLSIAMQVAGTVIDNTPSNETDHPPVQQQQQAVNPDLRRQQQMQTSASWNFHDNFDIGF